MTSNNTRSAAPAVVLRADGDVDAETVTYARTKIDAVLGRPGLPSVAGEVRITRASAHHAGSPWSAAASLRVGRREVIVAAVAADGHELVDQLQDRLRRQTDRAAHAGHDDQRTQAPPWRGGGGEPHQA